MKEKKEIKKLYRKREGRVLFGVCAGLGDYFDLDPIIIRMIFIIFTAITGAGVLIYIILAVIMPLEGDEDSSIWDGHKKFVGNMKDEVKMLRRNLFKTKENLGHERDMFATLLIFIGFIALIDNIFPMEFSIWSIFWPAIIISTGLYFLMQEYKSR